MAMLEYTILAAASTVMAIIAEKEEEREGARGARQWLRRLKS